MPTDYKALAKKHGGYSVDDVPAFLRPTAEQSKVVVQPPNGKDIAVVHSSSPNEVDVNEIKQFRQPQLNHEETHVFDFSRNPAIVQRMEGDLQSGALPKTYDYGGIDGLLKAQLQHKTIADFGPEQHAEMVKDFQQQTQNAIKTGNAALLDRVDKAYGPFIKQLASLPGRGLSMTTMTQKDLTPAAPGLPPATETGILEPNPLLGGPARVLPQPGDKYRKPVDAYSNPEDEPSAVSFKRNQAWSKPGNYVTKLSPQEEQQFQSWVKMNKVPWQDKPDADYDMRGYWKALKNGKAKQSLNSWDHKMHFPDTWKTPYNGVFSRESIYAAPNAPKWVGNRLIDAQGRVIADETPRKVK